MLSIVDILLMVAKDNTKKLSLNDSIKILKEITLI